MISIVKKTLSCAIACIFTMMLLLTSGAPAMAASEVLIGYSDNMCEEEIVGEVEIFVQGYEGYLALCDACRIKKAKSLKRKEGGTCVRCEDLNIVCEDLRGPVQSN